MKNVYFLSCLLLLSSGLFAQSSDVELGCAPLAVSFTAPAGQSTFFWEFQNGSQSTQANPSTIFNNPGTYEVSLFDNPNGNLIGSLTITVLEEPQLMIGVEEDMDCAPFTVSFTNNSTWPSQINNPVFNWTFGDGAAMEGENVSHTYTVPGVYDISLRLTSELTACNQEVPFPDFITVLPAVNSPQFTASPTTACDVPAIVTFSNTTIDAAGYNYAWDFGNGNTSTERAPGTQIYTEAGVYNVSLTVSNAIGCEKTFSQTLAFDDGPPAIDLTVPDSMCLGAPFIFMNATAPTNFSWTFTNSSTINSTAAMPEVTFDEAGLATITLSAGSGDCMTTMTYTTIVYQPDATFTLSPDFFCERGEEITLQANNTSYPTYEWQFHEEVNSPTLVTTIPQIMEDTFLIHEPQPVFFALEVTDAMGCSAAILDSVILHQPWAHFWINNASGCVPLTLEFRDSSTAATDLVFWEWIFDDGTTIESTNNDPQSHTYTEAGVYYPRLIVEDSNGCRDTSDAVRILVGDAIGDLDFTLSSDRICLGDSINLAAVTMDDRIDAWHFDTDNGRSFHCFQEDQLSHVFFSETGTFDVTMTVEYNGCYSSVTKTDTIEVLGPLARIDYMAVCEAPYDVMLMDDSEQAATTTWSIPELDTVFSGSNITYTFPERGTYTIFLEASNPATGCANHRDSVEVIISDILADFPLEERYCQGEPIILSASDSQGVDNDCSKGYTWILPGLPRPRTIDDPTIDYTTVGTGEQPYTLIVEDTNGCKDTLTQTTRIYSLNADFLVDQDTVCLPAELNFTDLSTADTLLSRWEWSFGATDPNPTFTFAPTNGADITVSLRLTDTVGCVAIASQIIHVYEPFSIIDVLPQNMICLGETIQLTATDFTEQGSFLNFNWNFGNGQNSDLQNPTVDYVEAGSYTVSLLVEEDATGCENTLTETIEVLAFPTADFISSVDTLAIRCAGQVAFTNLSSPLNSNFTWTFIGPDGNLVAPPTSEVDPSFFLEKGITEVQLIAANSLGCSDTLVSLIDLTAPEGLIVLDDNQLCLDELATFTATNLVDVSSFLWDFGDGTVIADQNSVAHAYDFFPPNGTANVNLILYTGDEACETIVDTLVFIHEVVADFIASEVDPADCSVEFTDESIGAVNYQWDFGDGSSSQEVDPTHLFPVPNGASSDTFMVQLAVSDADGFCADTAFATIIIEIDLEQIQMPNAFTPNGQEPNNFFNFVIVDENGDENIEVKRFQIFNRWGQLIYDNDTPETGWDGTIGNKEAPEEAYAYVIELELKGGYRWEMKGNVTLLRPD